MTKITCLCFVIAAAIPAWSQVEPSATGGPVTLDDTRMMTPPPISGGVYPTNVGSETRSNLISGGIVVTGAYNDNILADLPEKVSDENYSIVPTIALDRRTPRQSELLNYSAGFTLYQKTTELNGVTQSGSAEYRLHLSRYAVLSIKDSFQQNYDLFNEANPFTGVSIGATSANAVYVFPFQNHLGNVLDGGIAYQYGRNAMIGGGGSYSIQRYSDIASIPGLDDSNVGEGSAFVNRRIGRGQYIGAVYDYDRINTHPVLTSTDTNAISGFYTKYFTSTISISVMGGPQHYSSHDPNSGITAASWTPAVQGSAGYQTLRTNFAASYSRSVSGPSGLIGAYLSDIAGLQAQRLLTRRWSVGVSGSYALFKSVTPNISTANPGGHSITGTGSLERIFTERFRAEIGYSRIHQDYGNFGAISQLYPDANREYASVTYQFSRPLGR